MSTQVLPRVLTTRQLQQFSDQGYLVLPGVLTLDEVAALSSEADTLLARTELIDTANLRCRWADHVQSGECLFDCFDPVTDIGPVARYFSREPRLLAFLADLYGEPAHLLKDKLIFKRPGAVGYDLHQDYISWPEFPRSFITVILAIDATGPANGGTEVFPGQHRRGYLSPEDGNYHVLGPEQVDTAHGVVLELAPGDVAIFHGFMPHRSGPNQTDRWRRQLYFSYNRQSDGGEQRAAHYRQFHTWLKQKYLEYGRGETYFR